MIYMDLFDGPHSSSGLSWALLGGLEGLTERWALFCCLRFAKPPNQRLDIFLLEFMLPQPLVAPCPS